MLTTHLGDSIIQRAHSDQYILFHFCHYSCVGFGDVAAVTIFLFDVSMRWIGLRLDLMASMMTVGTSLVLILTKGLIPPASGGLVLGLCGKVSIPQVYNCKFYTHTLLFQSGQLYHIYSLTLSFMNIHARLHPL